MEVGTHLALTQSALKSVWIHFSNGNEHQPIAGGQAGCVLSAWPPSSTAALPRSPDVLTATKTPPAVATSLLSASFIFPDPPLPASKCDTHGMERAGQGRAGYMNEISTIGISEADLSGIWASVGARKLFFGLQLPWHASYAAPALSNATRQVHAVFGPAEGGIDVKNGSSSFEPCNVSATSRDVTLSDVESHAPDEGSRDNLTPTLRLFLGCCMASASSTSVDASSSRYSNNATCPHDGFTTAALQRASPTGLTAASLHKSSNSIIPPRLQLLHKGFYHSRSQQSIQDGI
ncbi:hypothetical protein M422DRAFT_272772 [Sphaerobolus stellatus SS14]|uniref:Uncharacterized protein n=1 Tax=Sphaerobolus stellatus (strain SS14) TaxID=990650 RepID=A0A0C9UL33_SPHS4|nr:hypothetical protein M422DRAFT_272772 [Sphaerobolus stellatus SS14]